MDKEILEVLKSIDKKLDKLIIGSDRQEEGHRQTINRLEQISEYTKYLTRLLP